MGNKKFVDGLSVNVMDPFDTSSCCSFETLIFGSINGLIFLSVDKSSNGRVCSICGKPWCRATDKNWLVPPGSWYRLEDLK